MKHTRRRDRQVTEQDESPDLLAQLKRVYGGQALQTDHFGRRPALPSEIERLLARDRDTGKVDKPR